MLKFAVGNWVESIYGGSKDFSGENISESETENVLHHSLVHQGFKPRFASIRHRRRCESAAPSLAGHRRSLASVSTSTPAPPSSQSVILRNSNNGASTLTVRVRPSSRNSSILGVDDAPSPATSSAYSNATARSSLILPSSASSSSHYYQSYPQSHQRDQQRFLNASPYDTTATLIPNSSTPIISPTLGGNESPRIWRSPNHTTTMIINDQNSQNTSLFSKF
uniref:Uncharacterized protein n=1 Tax=Panagrolaimus sp. ES5 TaxID=591445 RepID=A0AC34F666_9BILA